jgi:hypothetical protein
MDPSGPSSLLLGHAVYPVRDPTNIFARSGAPAIILLDELARAHALVVLSHQCVSQRASPAGVHLLIA